MKKIFYILCTVCLLVCSCTTPSERELIDKVMELQRRILTWEQQRDEFAAELAKMQAIVTAINNKDWVESVEEVYDSNNQLIGYTLNFSKSGPVTVLNGKEGKVPVIGVKLSSDGYYYWTLDGEYMLDAQGNKIKATPNINGIEIQDGVTPHLKIEKDETDNEDYWWVSYDKEEPYTNWIKLGKAQGSGSAFLEVDVTNLAYIRLVLMDESELYIPRYAAVRIGDGTSNDAIEVSGEITIPILLPANFKADDYSAIKAKIETSAGAEIDVVTKADVKKAPWPVQIIKPTFEGGVYQNDAAVVVTPASDAVNGDIVLLEVTLIDKNGQLASTARALKYVMNLRPQDCTDLSAEGNANCYIVNEGGLYRIDATVIGNGAVGLLDPAYHTTDATISPATARLVWADNENLISGVTLLESKWLCFKIEENVKGNAVVAVLSRASKIIWSWHIWVGETPGEVTIEGAEGTYTLLDRNLGATAATKESGEAAYGLYYQQGRKDPFPRYPIAVSSSSSPVSIASTIEAPDTFFKLSSTSDSWEVTKNLNKWAENAKSIYDPCPNGYRVCKHSQIATLGSKDATAGYEGGVELSGMWFPASGNLKPQDGSFNGGGERTDLWSSTNATNQDRPYRVLMRINDWNITNGCSAYGFSIRCVKE